MLACQACGITGTMAAHSGQVVKWEDAIESETDLGPESYNWDAEPLVKPGPDGMYACAMPGKSKPY